MSIAILLLPFFVLIALSVGGLMFLDVAFDQRQRPVSRGPLPLRQGRDLRDWATIQGRSMAEQWLKAHPGPVDGAALARELEQTSSEIVAVSFNASNGRKKSLQRCLDPHGTPRVSVPEALAILQDLRQNRPADVDSIRDRVARNRATCSPLRPDGDANAECPLATGGGLCLCAMSRPLPCRGRCVAGFDDTPAEAETAAWAQTLGDGLITGACEALEPRGLDAGRYDLNRALAVLLDHPEAEAKWKRGEPIFAAAPATASDDADSKCAAMRAKRLIPCGSGAPATATLSCQD